MCFSAITEYKLEVFRGRYTLSIKIHYYWYTERSQERFKWFSIPFPIHFAQVADHAPVYFAKGVTNRSNEVCPDSPLRLTGLWINDGRTRERDREGDLPLQPLYGRRETPDRKWMAIRSPDGAPI